MFCAVADCPNISKSQRSRRSFAFPKSVELQQQWLDFCQRDDEIDTSKDRICDEHFTSDDFERDLQFELGLRKNPRPPRLKEEAVPSMYHEEIEALDEDMEITEEEERERQALAVAQRKQIVDALLAEYDENQAKKSNQVMEAQEYVDFNDEDYEQDDTEVNVDEYVEVRVNADAYLKVLEKENTELKRQNFKMKLATQDNAKSMQKLEKKLEQSEERYTQLVGQLEQVFSKAQLDRLQNGRIVWPEEDLVDACALYAASGKAYDILLNRNYPLPSIRTLQNWDARQRVQLVEDNDPHADCTIHHWRCTHRSAKTEQRRGLRKEAMQKQREQQSKELQDAVVIPNSDHNYVHN